jgi:hypothetical protein
MDEELKKIFKLLSISSKEAAGHRWIACSSVKTNAYRQISEDAFRLDFQYQESTFTAIKEAFKSEYSISNEASQLFHKYGYVPTAVRPEEEALFTTGVEKIPNFDGYAIRHHKTMNLETKTAMETSFLNNSPIKLGTIQKEGDNPFLLASSPAGGRYVYNERENVLIIKSKTGKFITPVAREDEPEVIFVGAEKQFTVKNILRGKVPDWTGDKMIEKTFYVLEERG